MHLLESLNAGVRGAENGHVELYRRGTSTRATWYASFEGDGQDASGDDIPLDAHGGETVYVNELVRVVVKDAAGDVIRDYVAGHAASAVELRSDSFLGVNYVTANEDAGEPVNLAEALDTLIVSFGAADGKVAFRSDERLLQDALAALDQGVFVAKDAAYGAVGNGVADDSSAIQAALTAAGVNGGVVYLPPGRYRLTQDIAIPQNVSLRGAGPACTTIALDHATEHAITFSVALRQGCTIEGIAFDVNQAAAGNLIYIDEQDTRLTVRDCRFAPTTATLSGICITSALVTGLQVRIDDCYFAPNSVNANAITLQRGSPVIVGCQFVAPAGAANNQMIRADGEGCYVAFCRFQFSAVIGGSCVGILATNNLTSGRPCIVIGNAFGSTSGGTVSAWQLNCTSGNGVAEAANIVASGINVSILGLWDTTANEVTVSGSWEDRMVSFAAGAGVTQTLSEYHGHQTISFTGAGMTITVPTVRVGKTLKLLVHNNGAGAQNVNFVAGAWRAATGLALPNNVAANSFILLHMHGVAVNGASNYWVIQQVSDDLGE